MTWVYGRLQKQITRIARERNEPTSRKYPAQARQLKFFAECLCLCGRKWRLWQLQKRAPHIQGRGGGMHVSRYTKSPLALEVEPCNHFATIMLASTIAVLTCKWMEEGLSKEPTLRGLQVFPLRPQLPSPRFVGFFCLGGTQFRHSK